MATGTTTHRVVNRDGDVTWTDGQSLHREDGPAIERADGTREWWVHGRRHREDGPAVITSAGDRLWFVQGRTHRDDGPAREMANGDREWFRDGYRHRLDGPAVMHASGRVEHWVDGRVAHTGRAVTALVAAYTAGVKTHRRCSSDHLCQGVPLPEPRHAPTVAHWAPTRGAKVA